MAMFEVEDGRGRLVQPLRPNAASFVHDCRTIVSQHLVAVLGEPLFVVRSTPPDLDLDGPDALAIDAQGALVVVVVAPVLDEATLVAAARTAGAASRLTAADLARAYPDSPRFADDYAAFRDRRPFVGEPAPVRGARLVVLCSEVASDARDPLTYLRAPGRRIDVLEVGVVRGTGDRRVLDVSPLPLAELPRRSLEQPSLRLVRPPAASVTLAAYDTERTRPVAPRRRPQAPVRTTLPSVASGPMSAPTPIRRPSAPAPAAVPVAHRAYLPPRTLFGAPPPPSPSRPVEPPPVIGAPTFSSPARPVQEARVVTAENPAVAPATLPAAVGAEPPVALPTGAYVPTVPAPPSPRPPASGATPTPATSASPATPVTPVSPTTPAAGVRVGREAPTTPEGVPVVPAPADGPLSPGATGPRPDPALARLAAARGTRTPLVWVRERRGERHEAVLRPDGLVELPDGRVFADPDAAAAAAIDAENGADGWRSWRLEDAGSTLLDATRR